MVRIFFLLFVLVFVNTALAQEPEVTINGMVISQPFNVNLVNGTVTVKSRSGMFLGSTVTNDSGFYQLTFMLTNIKNENIFPSEFKISSNYPNPFNPSTNVDFYTPQNGSFKIEVFDISGEKITERDFVLEKGIYTFSLSGLGSAGVKIVSITGSNVKRISQKIIQLDGAEVNPSIDISASKNNHFNFSKNSLSDSVKVLFSASNHQTDSIVVAVEPLITLNYELQQIPIIKNANIQGHLINQQTNENVKNANVKVVDSDNNGVLVNVNTNNSGLFSGNYQYRLWTYGNDSITVPANITTTLSKNNYETKLLNHDFKPNITLNETLNNLGINYNFNIIPFDVNGVLIDSLTLHLQKNNGNAVFSKGPNNKINVNFTDYHDTPDTTTTLSHLNPEYLQWLIGRTPQQPLNTYNLFQTTRANNFITSPIILPTINLKNINTLQEDIHMYLIPKRIPHPFVAGRYLTMDGDTVNYMMRRDMPTGMTATSKFMPSVGSDTTDCVVLKWNRTTNNPVPQEKIQNTLNQFQKVLDAYTLENGASLLNYNLFTINDTTDAKWIELKNRGYDNMAYSQYENVSPSNGLSYGQPPGRIKTSVSNYAESQTNAIIFTEIYQQMVGNRDPPQAGSVGYVYKDGNMSQYGRLLLRMRALMNPATPY